MSCSSCNRGTFAAPANVGCGSCGQGNCASCSGHRNGRGSWGAPGCNSGSSVTSMSLLRNTVSEKTCCSNGEALTFVYNTSSTTVPANGVVAFDHVQTSTGSIVPPSSNGNDATQFKLLNQGIYQYDFFVKGVGKTAGVPGTNPLVFQLLANGNVLPGTQYTSQDKQTSETSLNHIVQGFGTITVGPNTTVQLHNATGSFGDTVDLIAFPTGGLGSQLAINASLRIWRTC